MQKDVLNQPLEEPNELVTLLCNTAKEVFDKKVVGKEKKKVQKEKKKKQR